ncbi:MAG: hypothetical protein K1X67_15875 [Fimbriimonadaceae bacterium]|nr:hypothetical protein [Fimbriimonadaceae bacterium]
MDNSISRREVFGLAGALVIAPSHALGALEIQKKERSPALEPSVVKDFVGAGHGDLDKVNAMLASTPGLLNATWDWGGGDFETAIGGAGHMGRADIARFLIEKGARYDIFVAAMLGELATVKEILGFHPGLLNSAGPHGISLIRHAEAGGEAAKEVLEYLKKLK